MEKLLISSLYYGHVLYALQKHRVLIPRDDKSVEEDRVSVVFFCQPDDDVLIETLDGTGKYPPITSGDWLKAQTKAILTDNFL